MMSSSGEHASGALFKQSDYVGMVRRALATVIDLIVLFVGCVLLFVMSEWFGWVERNDSSDRHVLLSCLAFAYLYLAICKSTPLRTVGYWIGGMRIVNYRGERPGLVRMTFRVLIWVLGPINPFVDWLWLGSDQHKQTLRDKFVGTYVVNAKAEPIGMSPRRAAYYNVLGMTLVFLEVQPISTTETAVDAS